MAIRTASRKPSKGEDTSSRGFALLIAIIFMSVMLSFGLALGSLSYKQQVLASDALGSQYAFYVADAALECALYADQQTNAFSPYPSSAPASVPPITCDGLPPISTSQTYTSTKWVVKERFLLDNGKHCADVMVSKPAPSVGGTTYLYSQGYDVPCTTVDSPGNTRFSSRGIDAHY